MEMERNPLVSVIVTVYNLEPYLGGCLLSIVGQTYRNLEILVINDGSTDGSLAIAERFAAGDSRIRVLSKANEGLPLTRKRGVEESKGDYICWLDGDDYMQHDYMEKLVGAMLESDCDSAAGELMKVCGSEGVILPGPDDGVLSPQEFARGILLDRIFATVIGKVYKRELMEGLVWFPHITLWEDFLINIQVVLKRGYKGLRIVHGAYYYYVQHQGSMRRDRVKYEYIEDFIKCSESIFDGSESTAHMYLPERAVNMADRHYVYVRVLSNPWRGGDGLSVRMRDNIRDNRRAVKGKFSWLVEQATLLYPCRSCFPLVKVLVTLRKWGNSFAKRRGAAAVKYTVPAAGEKKSPEVLSK